MSSKCGRCLKAFLNSNSWRHSRFFKLNLQAQRYIHSTCLLNAAGTPIKMPSLSPTMMEGTIIKWLKAEGDPIQPGDVICDIQTDKAVVSFEIEEEGILAKILVKEDTKDIKIGTLIALLVEEGEDWKSVEMPVDEELRESPQPTATQSKEMTEESHSVRNFGPSVHLLLEKYGISPQEVTPAGPHGKLLKGDVLKVVQQRNLQPLELKVSPPAAPQPAVKPSISTLKSEPISVEGDFMDVELTNMRKTIAKRLSQSKSTIAHTYSTVECQIDELLKLRKQFKKDGVSVSVNDFIIKAVSVALTRCPEVNCIWEGQNLVCRNSVDMSVAVATDAGLITPIIRGADTLGLEEISNKIRDLAGRARQNKLKLNEFQGGTFTISNLGMFGITEFTAIINPPQCAILAVGGGRTVLGVDAIPETRMRSTLSYDQSAISDDTAALFMETLREIIENPSTMLLGDQPSRNVDHALAGLL